MSPLISNKFIKGCGYIFNILSETLNKQFFPSVLGKGARSSSVLNQLTADGEHVKSLLTWKRVGFTPLAASYRPADGLLMLGGESNRIKTFKLLSLHHAIKSV